MHAAVEDDRGVVAIGHPKLLSAREARQRDFARRRFPRPRMRLFPAEMPPVRLMVEWRPAIMADAEERERGAAVGCHTRSYSNFRAGSNRKQQCGRDAAVLR